MVCDGFLNGFQPLSYCVRVPAFAHMLCVVSLSKTELFLSFLQPTYDSVTRYLSIAELLPVDNAILTI
jgi:hypothetical protein